MRKAHQKALVQLGEAEAPVPGRRRRRRASRLSIVRTAPQAQPEESTRMEPPTSGRVSHTVTDATELEAPRVWHQGIRVAVVEGEPLETFPSFLQSLSTEELRAMVKLVMEEWGRREPPCR